LLFLNSTKSLSWNLLGFLGVALAPETFSFKSDLISLRPQLGLLALLGLKVVVKGSQGAAVLFTLRKTGARPEERSHASQAASTAHKGVYPSDKGGGVF